MKNRNLEANNNAKSYVEITNVKRLLLIENKNNKRVIIRDERKNGIVKKRNRSLQSEKRKNRLILRQEYIGNKINWVQHTKLRKNLKILAKFIKNKELFFS